MSPRILIVVEGGIAQFICATGPAEVLIMDLDAECRSAPVSFGGVHEDEFVPCSEAEFKAKIAGHCCPCAQCQKPILEDEASELTHCGYMHRDCMEDHAKACQVCRRDFAERTE